MVRANVDSPNIGVKLRDSGIPGEAPPKVWWVRIRGAKTGRVLNVQSSAVEFRS